MNTSYYKQNSQIESKISQENSNKTRPFMLKRIMYAMFLFSFLMIISFYFDLFQNYDFVSLLLGFFVCMIAQFKCLQYFFRYQMESMKIDQIGALRSKIKYLFGELNHQYLDFKNKRKYYHNNQSKQDKLFSKQSQQVFENTMQFLVSKNKNNHSQNIQKINRKWRIIISKLEIMKKFIASFLEIHNSRAKIYSNNLGKLARITESQFRIWKHLFQNSQSSELFQGKLKKLGTITQNSFSQDYQSFNGTFIQDLKIDQNKQGLKRISNLQQISKSSNFFKTITWHEVVRAFEQKQKINNQKLKDIRRVVFEQFKRFYDHMVIRQNKQISELNTLKAECQIKSKERSQISQLIQIHKKKMDQLFNVIINKNRTTQNHQQILKVQLQMRMLKVQCQNLEVKLSRCDDKIKQHQWQLYKKCLQQNKYLQGQALRLFNNKIQNYQNLIMEFQKNYSKFLVQRVNRINQSNLGSPFNKYEQDQQNKLLQKLQISQGKTAHEIIQAFKSRQKMQQAIKVFFQNLRTTFNELQENFRQTAQVIQKTQKQLFDKFNDQNSKDEKQRRRGYGLKEKNKKNHAVSTITSTYSSNMFYDRNFLDILASLARKDQKIMVRCKSVISEQYQMVLQQQNKKIVLNDQISKMCQRYKQKQQQKKKIQKYKNSVNGDSNYQPYNGIIDQIEQIRVNLQVKVRNYSEYVIPSTLNGLLSQIVERHLKLQQFVCAHQNKHHNTQHQTNQEGQQQQKNYKFKQYRQYARRLQSHNLDDPIYNFNRIQTKKGNNDEDNLLLTSQGTQQDRHLQSKAQSLKMLNKLLSVFFQQWSNSQFFHELIKQQLQISLNSKRPVFLEPLVLQYLKIQEKSKDSGFQDILPHQTEVFRCLFDVRLNFKGKIAVHIKSKLNFGNRNPLNIKLLIKQFRCPLRICFNPYSIGKSYVSLLQRPHLNVEYDVMLSDWHLNKIPFLIVYPDRKNIHCYKIKEKDVVAKKDNFIYPFSFQEYFSNSHQRKNPILKLKIKKEKVISKIVEKQIKYNLYLIALESNINLIRE